MDRRLLPMAVAIACGACSGGTLATNEPTIYEHTFPAIEVEPFDELTGVCQSWTLGNEEDVFVNAVTMEAGPGWHHANWMFVPEGTYPGPDGSWDCDSRDYDEVDAGLAGGVLFAQSTQSTGETQAFPLGAGFRVPARSKVVAEVHLVNAESTPLSTAISLSLLTLSESQVVTRLRPFAASYFPLEIPPHVDSVFSTTCDAQDAHLGQPLDFAVYYVLPHYHAWGTGFYLKASGPGGEVTVFDEEGVIGEAWGLTMNPPVDLTGMTTIEFGCRYHNDTDAPLDWGNDAQSEMCMMLAYTDDSRRWLGGAVQGPTMVVGTDANGAVLHTAPCSIAAL